MKRAKFPALAAAAACIAAGAVALPAPAQAATGCSVTYRVLSAWPNGFQGEIVLRNTGDAWSSWSLKFAFPGGQSATQGWGGEWTTGSAPTVNNASWNGSVGNGGTVTLGFIGGGDGNSSTPSSFSVNGTTCGGGTSTSSSTTTTSSSTTSRTTTSTTSTRTTSTTSTTSSSSSSTTGSGTPVARWGQLSVCGAKMCDQGGNPVQLRGVSSMWLNWEDDGYAENLSALRHLRDDWGITVIRASMGVEPSGAYLSNPSKARGQVERIINNAIELGLYVIVDWHSHEAQNNTQAAVDFFGDLAKRYGQHPNLLWEPYNEPLQISWTGVLKPYHEAVLRSIRASDPDNIVILGTPQWSQRILDAAASPLTGSNLMYTVHFYSCTHGSQLRGDAEQARQSGLAIFVTEWGATHADGGLDGRVCEGEGQAWVDWMKQHQISWAAWKLDGCTDSSCLLRAGAPVSGPWDNWLQGHGPFVRQAVRG